MSDPEAVTTPTWYRAPEHPQRSQAVAVAQRMLGLRATGDEDETFELTLTGFRVARNYRVEPGAGVLTERDAQELGERRGAGYTPEWFAGDGPYEHYATHLAPHGITGEPALRRFQSENMLPTTGLVDLATVRLLAVYEDL